MCLPSRCLAMGLDVTIYILLGSRSVGHYKQNVSMYMFPIPNGFRDRAISLYSTLYTVQTSNTLRPRTSCKVH
jgi:hypothetical protein